MSGVRAIAASRLGPAHVGAALIAATGVWVVLTAAWAGVSPLPVLASLLVVAAGVALSWVLAIRWPVPLLASFVVGALMLIVANPAGVLGGGALQPPLGYANATAALYAMATVAVALLLVMVVSDVARIALVLAGLAFVGVVVVGRSWAAAILLAGFLAGAYLAERVIGARAAVVGCGVAFLVALVATQTIGATQLGTGDGPVDMAIGSVLSAERVALWHDAIEMTAREPLLGVGAGGFAASRSVARTDPDLRWAHHEYLQAGAEMGLPGYVFVVALVAWGFVTLWLTAAGPVSAVAAAGLGVVSTHASLDYVFHFPAVLAAVAVVVGTGIGATSRGERAETRSEVAR